MRQRKPQKVDTISLGRSRMAVDLFLDRNSLDFFAKLGLETVRDPTVEGLRAKAREAWANWQPEVWDEFIFVSVGGSVGAQDFVGRGQTQNASMDIHFYRREVATRLDGEKVERVHRLDREERIRKLPSKYRQKEREHLETDVAKHWAPEDYVQLAYSDAAWSNLCLLRDQLAEMAAQAEKFVRRADFAKKISGETVVALLPPVAKTKERRG